jgi:hypothetical protein
MTRHAIRLALVALAIAFFAPSIASAYFPPTVGQTPDPVPPDPFGVPGPGGLGEPEPPDPGNVPNVQVPEPASMISALTGLAIAGAYGLRLRLKSRGNQVAHA